MVSTFIIAKNNSKRINLVCWENRKVIGCMFGLEGTDSNLEYNYPMPLEMLEIMYKLLSCISHYWNPLKSNWSRTCRFIAYSMPYWLLLMTHISNIDIKKNQVNKLRTLGNYGSSKLDSIRDETEITFTAIIKVNKWVRIHSDRQFKKGR